MVVLDRPESAAGDGTAVPGTCFDRTLSEWVAMIVDAGLVIEAMGEPRADDALARAEPGVADTAVVPLFLHVRARKPGLAA